MITKTFDAQSEWFAERVGKITGSTLKDIIVEKGKGEKIGYYQLIADVVAIPDDGENPMERGHRLEEQAVERFIMETGLHVNTGHIVWEREDESRIAVSPDGVITKEEALIIPYIRPEDAIEVKCLSSARHLEAYLTQQIPNDYRKQTIQYFIVNDDLRKLHVVFFDPRVPCKDYFVILVRREEVQDLIDEYLLTEKMKLQQVDNIVTMLRSGNPM